MSKVTVMAAAAAACVLWMDVPRAEACGSFAPLEGETASLTAQRVTMAYDEESNTTRVIAQISFDGDLTAFSWLIPLPAEPTNVQALGQPGADLFAELDAHAQPRFGITTCGLNNGGGGDSFEGEVLVLGGGTTGSFEYVVLSGDSGGAVTDWLTAEGYGVPEGMDEIAHTYIREGNVFMAMKVNPELAGEKLDPAIRFDYEGWPGYPLRIAQATTDDELEIILNVVAAQAVAAEGAEQLIPSIEWDGYEPLYLDKVREAGRNGDWAVEYRRPLAPWTLGEWGDQVPVTDELQALLTDELGMNFDSENPPVLTRLHGIFPAEQLVKDTRLTLGDHETAVPFYDVYQCDWDEDDGWIEDEDEEPLDNGPGSDQDSGDETSDLDKPEPGHAGCSTTGGNEPGGLLLLVALFFVRARRRLT